MKYFTHKLIFLFFLFFFNNVISCNKIAIVDINNIFNNLSKFYKIEKILNKEFGERAINLHQQELRLQHKIDYLNRDSLALKENTRNKMKKEINNERNMLILKAKIFEKDNKRRQLEEQEKILNKIQSIIYKIALNKKYDLIIDSNTVVYSNGIKNITNEVLKQIK